MEHQSFWKRFLTGFALLDSCIGLLGVIIILGGAIVVEHAFHEPPCPLCLLQRAAFVSIGLSLLMNIRYRNHTANWACAILSGCAGITVSIRQILLHITSPKGFGSAFFGLHMYTWCFFAFAATIVGSALMLLIYPEHGPCKN